MFNNFKWLAWRTLVVVVWYAIAYIIRLPIVIIANFLELAYKPFASAVDFVDNKILNPMRRLLYVKCNTCEYCYEGISKLKENKPCWTMATKYYSKSLSDDIYASEDKPILCKRYRMK